MIKREDGAIDLLSVNRYVLDANTLLGLLLDGDAHNEKCEALYKLITERDQTDNPVFIISPASIFVEVNMKFHKHKKLGKSLRDKFSINNSATHPIDDAFIQYMNSKGLFDKFSMLGSQDVLYAVVAHFYDASLVTFDNDFNQVSHIIKVINLNQDPLSKII